MVATQDLTCLRLEYILSLLNCSVGLGSLFQHIYVKLPYQIRAYS